MFGNKPQKDKRFKLISEESFNLTSLIVIQDTKTGVNYLITQGVNGLSTTVLLDEDGNQLVTEVEKEN
jgi:hypothetical protein